MTIASVINDVCLTVGVAQPVGSVFPASAAERTKAEMISLANEMAERVAFETRDWTALRRFALLTSNGVATELALPSDFKRMLKTTQVYKGGNYNTPMKFVSDPDEWLRTTLQVGPQGDWMLRGNYIQIRPVDPFGTSYEFPYICHSCITATGGGYQSTFLTDTDVFVLSERVLKLGMIWKWRADKGGSYTESMQDYEDALSFAAGADKPSPILVSGHALSQVAANIGYPYQLIGPPL